MPKFYGQNKKRKDPRYFLNETVEPNINPLVHKLEDWDEIIHDGRPAEFRGLVPNGSGMVEIEYKDTKGHAEITQVDSWEIETEWMEESGYYKNPDRDEIDSGIGKKAMGSMGKAHDDKVKAARKKKAKAKSAADAGRIDRMASTGEGGWYKVGKKKKK